MVHYLIRIFSITIACNLFLLAMSVPLRAQSCLQQCQFSYITCLERKLTATLSCQQIPSCRAGCQKNKDHCIGGCTGNYIERKR